MEVILISGKAREGKDSFGNALDKAFREAGKRVLVIHYADFLKFFCNRCLGWVMGDKSAQGRHILQHTGTEVFRNNYPDCWVDIMVGFLRGCYSEYDYVIIPDARFPNEIESLKAANRKFNFATRISAIRVVRPNFVSDLTPEQKQHPSEIALDNYPFRHYYYNNKNTLQELEKDGKEWAKAYLTDTLLGD